MSVNRYDRVPIGAKFTEDGYLEDSPVLTRTGVFVYRDGNGKERRELRLPEDVFKADSLATYRNKPITKGHPGKVNAGNLKAHQIGTVTSEGRQDGDNVVSDIVIHDPRVIKQDGWKELSVGYAVDLIDEPGEYNGERYDAIQTNIRVNHLAVVPIGRAGNARLNLDAADAATIIEGVDDAETPTNEDSPVMNKIRLDNGIEYDAVPEVAQAYNQARSDAKAIESERDKEKARADDAESKLAAKDQEIEQLKQDGVKQARARVELETAAKEHGVEIKQDSTDRSIKEAVIKKLRTDAALDGQSDAYVDATFDIVTKDATQRRNDAASQRKTATIINQDAVEKPQASAASARQKMSARLRGEKVEGDQ
ncbi:DUF2213 domain-containing protein [Vreelandella venusta]|uniref:DUF2213 domain-containing protein n=1 Tax=Vreelandella venusta TaxID=44935 RepID=UPI0018DABB3C|nr:DUF2213 domain-containing protein [Halomonas venusta]QPI62430.1 DUF2213 domain-containing protein [Halomonas venusta]